MRSKTRKNINNNEDPSEHGNRSRPSPEPSQLPLPTPSSSRLNHIPEDSYNSETVSPFEAPHRYNNSDFYYGALRRSSTLRHVQRVSKRAALASKKVIWDSNDNAIDAAQSAVDQWEDVYNALRVVLVTTTQSATKLYGAAKAGATGLEHGILVPVRDWILLPAFDAAENTIGFLQSDEAHQVASQSLQLAHQVPFLGPTVLAPSMVLSVQMIQTAWQIAQYPIPSRHQVRNSVDFVLTGTKWALTTTVREVLLYIKRADAIITRTLSHTQWKVLGSGPYATLDKLNKQEVIDHLCERYFSLKGTIARYELAAHIRTHNLPLYLDLVLTGLLRERGGELTNDDEWLSSCPSYRKNSKESFLLPNYDYEADSSDTDQLPESRESNLTQKESALWFRLPYANGKRPGRDVPWVRFNGADRAKLERQYLGEWEKCNHLVVKDPTVDSGLERPATSGDQDTEARDFSSCQSKDDVDSSDDGMDVASGYPTIAQWYVPDLKQDVLVDQKRYSVSFHKCCPRCRQQLNPTAHELPDKQQSSPPKVCQNCADSQAVVTNHWMASSILSPPPLSMVMRPNLWRFHGPGDEVRRAVWFMDTRRHGLQPYGEEAQAVLEDAYLFLRWRNEYLKEGLSEVKKEPPRQPITENTCPDQENGMLEEEEDPMVENSLLTVQVESPDGGVQQLVQFSSLTAATAIKKGLGGAISLFKRRVYRGADLSHPKLPESANGVSPEAVFEIDLKAQSRSQPKDPENFSDECRNGDDDEDADWTVLPTHPGEESMAVPATQFDEIDRDPVGRNNIEEEAGDGIDHLVLIVHGIGEMLQSVDLFGLAIPNLSSIVECCGFLRNNHAEVQSPTYYATSEATSTALSGRVEYLPIEWHEAFSIMSQRMSPSTKTRKMASPADAEGQLVPARNRSSRVMMQDISLRTIPQMRTFANDTLCDVLYFMSTEHHDVIVDIVSNEMNVVVQKFRALTGFHGRVSVIGHSLGSIITWDILANQTPNMESIAEPGSDAFREGTRQADDWANVSAIGSSASRDPSTPGDAAFPSRSSHVAGGPNQGGESTACATEEEARAGQQRNEGPGDALVRHPSSSYQYPKLLFDVDNAFMLGSPIAVFLMVRNQAKPLSPSYSLKGCSRVYNIFHPYDPVAYRIEPLLAKGNADFEPRLMTHWNGGFRVQYQTKRLWRRLVHTTMQTQQTVIERLEAGIAGMGLLDSPGDQQDEDNQSQPSSGMNEDDRLANNIVTGKLNQGRRIDYMLQEKEIEAANEYVAALAAHSCYWQEKDLSLFIARQIYLGRLAHEQALHFESLLPLDDEMAS